MPRYLSTKYKYIIIQRIVEFVFLVEFSLTVSWVGTATHPRGEPPPPPYTCSNSKRRIIKETLTQNTKNNFFRSNKKIWDKRVHYPITN
jgi:hypothetical protein